MCTYIDIRTPCSEFCSSSTSQLIFLLIIFVVQTRVFLQIRSGIITIIQVSFSANPTVAMKEASVFCELLQDKKLYEIGTFSDMLNVKSDSPTATVALAQWLDEIFSK